MEGRTRKETALAALTAGIEKLTTSDAWQAWLDLQGRFHQYSFYNCLLIQSQFEGAARVAGFHAWRKLGRNVRKGEKGIWILAPMTRRVTEDDATDENGKRIVSGFKAVPVFDVSQTDGADLPEVCSRLQGNDTSGAYAQLLAVAHGLGFTVEDAELPGGINGDCTHDLHRIRVEVRNAPAQRVKTLAHEIAHAILHEKFEDRALAELEAESVAYVVCSGLELSSDDYTFGYVAGWAGGGESAITAIKASGSRIQQTAESILSRLETMSAASSAVA